MPGLPRSFLCKVRRGKVMGWISKRTPKGRAGSAGHSKWPPALLQLADPQGLQFDQSPGSTQMLRVRETRPQGSRMPSSTEGVILSPPTTGGRGRSSWLGWDWKGDIPTLFRGSQRVSMWEYHRFRGHMPPRITHPLNPWQMYIVKLSIASLQLGTTSACSAGTNWSGRWALSNHHLYPSSPK